MINKTKKRIIIIAAFGNRATQVQRLVNNIRKYVDYPICILTTDDSQTIESCVSAIDGSILGTGAITKEYVERRWPVNSLREGVRNSNYHKIRKTLQVIESKESNEHNCKFDSVLLLDDDMYIVNKNFIDGFDIAERFGAALPLNPRVYVKYNAMGADVQQKDIDEISHTPVYAPACNFSPFFVSTKKNVNKVWSFLSVLKRKLEHNVCRGTLAVWKTGWQTGFTPVYLPEQWCVCGGPNAQYIHNYKQQLRGGQLAIPPMMLHLGHDDVRRVFADMIDEN